MKRNYHLIFMTFMALFFIVAVCFAVSQTNIARANKGPQCSTPTEFYLQCEDDVAVCYMHGANSISCVKK